MNQELESHIQHILGLDNVDFSIPPKPEMGDMAIPCFELAKKEKQNPVEFAKNFVENFSVPADSIVKELKAFGPYINVFLDGVELAKFSLQKGKDPSFGSHVFGERKKIMVEYVQPNTHKAFHIGHLRNITTGEAVVRILENVDYEVIRANYQGDVGMHIAKCLYGIKKKLGTWNIDETKYPTIDDKVKFLGEAYALGGTTFEEDEEAKKEIVEINDKIYSQSEDIQDVYKKTRAWSLEYFDKVYKRVYTHFDRLYFESEVYERAVEIVKDGLSKGIFKESDGAIIFEGSKYKGLHDRVFINSKGFPTYEAKDLALAEKQFAEYNPDNIYHVVAREQAEYFKVMFKAQEQTLPISAGKQHHLIYGWVTLKEGKMSSRTGNVILGEWLLDEVKKNILAIMQDTNVDDRDAVAEKVAIAAVKYSFLKTGVVNDIQFDMKESISTSGDSGPYLLYIVARIKSILKKLDVSKNNEMTVPEQIEPAEKQLLMKLLEFERATQAAAEEMNPAKIAQYLFNLAQDFNSFYQACPVVKAEVDVQQFRRQILLLVESVMVKGLHLLGIEAVDEM